MSLVGKAVLDSESMLASVVGDGSVGDDELSEGASMPLVARWTFTGWIRASVCSSLPNGAESSRRWITREAKKAWAIGKCVGSIG